MPILDAVKSRQHVLGNSTVDLGGVVVGAMADDLPKVRS